MAAVAATATLLLVLYFLELEVVGGSMRPQSTTVQCTVLQYVQYYWYWCMSTVYKKASYGTIIILRSRRQPAVST